MAKVSDQSKIAVWWVNQADCESINDEQVPSGYIRKEYESRLGRAGRGRLWVPNNISCQQVEVPSSVCSDGQDTHGGIVILKEDIEKVRPLGGILSDAQGNIL